MDIQSTTFAYYGKWLGASLGEMRSGAYFAYNPVRSGFDQTLQTLFSQSGSLALAEVLFDRRQFQH